MRKYWIARGLKFAVFAAVAVTVGSTVVMWPWNWVMPATFGLPALTLGKAFALLVLTASCWFGSMAGWGVVCTGGAVCVIGSSRCRRSSAISS